MGRGASYGRMVGQPPPPPPLQRLNGIRFQCEVDYKLSDGSLALCNRRLLLRDSKVGVRVSCDL